MKSFLCGVTTNSPTAGSTQYQPFVTQGSASSWGASLTADLQSPLPHAITLDRLRVKVNAAPGTGKNFVFTVLKNGVTTALTCTISGTNTAAQDLSHTVSFAAGDTITLQGALDTGGTAPTTTWWTARQDASGLSAILGASVTTSLGFFAPMGYNTNTKASGDGGIIVPCAGTIENLYVNASASGPVVTIYKNGVATSLAVTLSGATGSDTLHTVSVVAGDRISVDTTTSGKVMGWGISFAPTTDGQSFIGQIATGNTNATSTVFIAPITTSGGWNATESAVQMMIQACTVVGLYSQTSVSPGVSPKAYLFTVRQNAANTTAAVTINDASSTPNDGSGRAGNITGQSITVSDDDLLDISEAPTGTPTGLHAYNSILLSVSGGAPAANPGQFFAFM